MTTEEAWAVGPPAPPPGGFLHLCTPDQLAFVLAQHFAERSGLVVLHVAIGEGDERLRWEMSEPGMAAFPHYYSAVLPEMVVRVQALD